MLEEIIQFLDIKKNGIYFDMTIGRAGHASEILKKIPQGFLVGFDKDLQAIAACNKKLTTIAQNFALFYDDYKNYEKAMQKLKFLQIDGFLIDLGVSSPQIDDSNRGFSYNKNNYLDMRMNQKQKLDAHYIINFYLAEDLEALFSKYADVKPVKLLVKAILKNRPINTTLELVDVLRNNLPANLVRKKNPAKAIFQALRYEVNQEIESLKFFFKNALDFLKPQGVIAILTFNSLEDKIVKDFIKKINQKFDNYRQPLVQQKQYISFQCKPKKLEILNNPRSKSAKLRIIKKLF